MFGIIKCELRRRSAIEVLIGHMKTDGHLGRCFLKGARRRKTYDFVEVGLARRDRIDLLIEVK